MTKEERIEECNRIIDVNKAFLDKAKTWSNMNASTEAFVKLGVEKAETAVKRERAKIRRLTSKPKEGAITEEMIQIARDFPMNQLVELKNRRCRAFCHESDSDSMMLTRYNTLMCFVCNEKPFDTIGVLMKRDGMSFVDAVKYLN